LTSTPLPQSRLLQVAGVLFAAHMKFNLNKGLSSKILGVDVIKFVPTSPGWFGLVRRLQRALNKYLL
jgi:hypothetical protein